MLGRIVAVKVLAERFADDEGIRRRFTHEALAAARLSNAPNTVTIFDVGEHGSRPYIVMEYLPGGSLADRLAAEGAQQPGRALAWLRQTARCSRRRPCRRDRPPRRQAGQPAPGRCEGTFASPTSGSRAPSVSTLHSRRHRARHCRLSRSRAGARRASDFGKRSLRVRRRRLRAPHRRASVCDELAHSRGRSARPG